MTSSASTPTNGTTPTGFVLTVEKVTANLVKDVIRDSSGGGSGVFVGKAGIYHANDDDNVVIGSDAVVVVPVRGGGGGEEVGYSIAS